MAESEEMQRRIWALRDAGFTPDELRSIGADHALLAVITEGSEVRARLRLPHIEWTSAKRAAFKAFIEECMRDSTD